MTSASDSSVPCVGLCGGMGGQVFQHIISLWYSCSASSSSFTFPVVVLVTHILPEHRLLCPFACLLAATAAATTRRGRICSCDGRSSAIFSIFPLCGLKLIPYRV